MCYTKPWVLARWGVTAGSSVGPSQGGCVLQAWVSSALGGCRGSLRGQGVPRAGGLLSSECHISKYVLLVFVKWLLYDKEAFLRPQLASGCSIHLERVFLTPICCLSPDEQCLLIAGGCAKKHTKHICTSLSKAGRGGFAAIRQTLVLLTEQACTGTWARRKSLCCGISQGQAFTRTLFVTGRRFDFDGVIESNR